MLFFLYDRCPANPQIRSFLRDFFTTDYTDGTDESRDVRKSFKSV